MHVHLYLHVPLRLHLHMHVPVRARDVERKDMTSIYLMMTNRCNMNCSYCYEREFFKDNKKDITLDTAKRAVDWLIERRMPGHKARPD